MCVWGGGGGGYMTIKSGIMLSYKCIPLKELWRLISFEIIPPEKNGVISLPHSNLKTCGSVYNFWVKF